LRFLGRAHCAEEGLRALDAALAAVPRVSFDLIYALPGDDEAGWARDLDRALALGTEHLSLYQLTIEPGTRFATDVAKGQFTPLDSETAAALFELTQQRTAKAGMPAYEISNHARAGAESRHNLTYWRYRDYAGIGPGAHGRRLGQRTVRHRKPENYLAAVARNGHGLVEEEELSPAEAAHERLVMGLRLAEGLESDGLVDWRAADRLVGHGLLWRKGERLGTTPAGRLVLDSILAEIAA
jgi:coproporphyrinogen III oxidase-like Fe-S oxidoreductase